MLKAQQEKQSSLMFSLNLFFEEIIKKITEDRDDEKKKYQIVFASILGDIKDSKRVLSQIQGKQESLNQSLLALTTEIQK